MNYIVYKTTNLKNGKLYIGVHKVIDPEIFDGYLGCGCYNSKPSSWDQDTNSIFPRAVKKYGSDSFKRETLFVYDFTEEGRLQAYDKEKELVNQNWVDDPNTYNICLGGITSNTISKKVRQYTLSGEYIQTWNSTKEAEEYYHNINQIHKVCELKHKSSAGFQWRYDSDNLDRLDDVTEIVLQNKTVYQFDLAGNLIKCWKSISEAAKQFDNFTSGKSGIKRNCEGYVKQSFGYYWSFKNKFLYNKDNKYIPIACYSKEGSFIKSYSNASDACSDLNLPDPSGIFSVISGKHKLCKNLRWRFFYGNTNSIKPLR